MPKPSDYSTTRILEEIGIAIDRVMHERQITIHQLAERVGVTNALMLKIIQGRFDLDLKRLVDIGLALGCRWKLKMRAAA